MDYVYVCRSGDNEELRYSLRSIYKNCPEGNVWLVGGKPDWYTGNFIPVKNTTNKFENIKNCIKNASQQEGISEDFVLMNDDFFVLKPQSNIPTVHGGPLINRVNEYKRHVGSNSYVMLLSRTNSALRSMGIENPIDYDIHTPMIINKQKLLDVVDNKHSIRSWYGNIHNIGGTQIQDVKRYDSAKYSFKNYKELDSNNPFLSTDDKSFKQVHEYLDSLFSKPSPYEI